METRLYIKNMVCPRCIMAVQQLLDKRNIKYKRVSLGEVDLQESLDPIVIEQLEQELKSIGFSLIDNRKSRLIEKMKNLIIQKIHHSDEELDVKWTDYITDHLNYDYKYLSMLFSSVESITLEQYIIRQKIERIKELMIYNELTLSQIAYQLGYSSVAHLSNQFKKITGMSPSGLKKTISISRKTIDDI